MKQIILLGPPGSGKTTLIKHFLSSKKNIIFNYISIGDITRKEIDSKTKLGYQIKYFLDSNKVYPLHLTSKLIYNHIDSSLKDNKKVILDGYPKFPKETKNYIKKNVDLNNILVIVFNLNLETALNRVKKRRICVSCGLQQQLFSFDKNICKDCGGHLRKRIDDEQSSFINRFKTHSKNVNTNVSLFKKVGIKVLFIDASQSKKNMLSLFKGCLKKLK